MPARHEPGAALSSLSIPAKSADAHYDSAEEEEQGLLLGTGAQEGAASAGPLPGLPHRLAAAAWGSGIVCILGAAAFFAVAASLVKAIERMDSRVTVFEIVCIRSLLSMAASFAAARARNISPLFGQLRHMPLLAMRGMAGAAAMTLFYESILRLPLADCITVIFCNPAICAVLGWVLLRERFGWLTVVGCLASLIGVILVAQPPFLMHLFSSTVQQQEWTHSRMIGMVLGVASAFLAAVAYITIRVIGKREQSLTIAMWFHTSACVTSAVPLLLGLPEPAVFPKPLACLFLLGVGCCSFSAQLLLNRGFQLELAARASAFNYTQVIWANILGLLFFDEALTVLGVSGALLIALGVLTVSADKKPAASAASEQARLPSAHERLKSKSSSYELEEAQAAGGPATASHAQLRMQLELLPAERHDGREVV